MIIVETQPGDLDLSRLTKAQNDRWLLPIAMGHFVKWLAGDLKKYQREAKDRMKRAQVEHRDIGHTRTPAAIGTLLAGVEVFLQFAIESDAITIEQADALLSDATAAILATAAEQTQHLTDTDPTDIFFDTIRAAIGSHKAHIRLKDGGIPSYPLLTGWTKSEGVGGIPTFKAHGEKFGWIDESANELLLNANTVYDAVRRLSRGGITLTKQTLFKRLKESGKLTRVDTTRSRNAMRVSVEGAEVMCLVVDATKALGLPTGTER